eukprot:TRINITY_DN3857_c0_g1_i4.p4 TRINITY_DN3857_c0_g1~~TRINITY_DN3857_c0_g1_i4.p4  ORF type:complete len:106 (-),score=15.47 TRINITY_DN3857_c0_g1_i4:451-768(-)
MEQYEQLAASLEQRLDLLEQKVGSSTKQEVSAIQVNMHKYVDDLKQIRESLVKAKDEIDQINKEKEEALKKIQEKETIVEKLKYQVNILKRSVKEGDEKLASITS